MRIFRAYTGMAALLTIGLSVASCHKIIDHSNPLCDYTVQLRYDYNQENTSAENQYSRYIKSAEEYIFDAEGVLHSMGTVTADPRTGAWVSEHDLPPGRYSIIVVGNRSTLSSTTDASTGKAPVIGQTHRDDILLTRVNQSTINSSRTETGHFENGERLYHGYRTFTIAYKQVSYVRVDMVHSHHVLKFRIRWKKKAPPLGDYYASMKYIPSEYSLMPEHIYLETYKCYAFDADSHDDYLRVTQSARHHIPTVHQDRNILTHKLHLKRNVDAEIKGEFVMYRIKNETTPTMVLYTGADDSGAQQMKEINLQRYFTDRKINLDQTLKQEYAIEILISDDQVLVSPITIADWDEGGTL